MKILLCHAHACLRNIHVNNLTPRLKKSIIEISSPAVGRKTLTTGLSQTFVFVGPPKGKQLCLAKIFYSNSRSTYIKKF
jgi:hypothetical protein